MRKESQPGQPGMVYEINLGGGHKAYGIVAVGGDVGFVNLTSEYRPSMSVIKDAEVALRVYVTPDVFDPTGWEFIGEIELPLELKSHGKYRRQPVGSNNIFLDYNGHSEPITAEEASRLEVAAAWHKHHIEERLKDHFAGRPNHIKENSHRIKKYDLLTGQEIKESGA